MKVIKFRPHLVPLVLSGEKYSTWRVNDDKGFEVGDPVSLVNWETYEEFAHGVVSFVRQTQFKDLTEADYAGHRTYESPEEMYEEFRGYYGDWVGPETGVKIVRFELVK